MITFFVDWIPLQTNISKATRKHFLEFIFMKTRWFAWEKKKMMMMMTKSETVDHHQAMLFRHHEIGFQFLFFTMINMIILRWWFVCAKWFLRFKCQRFMSTVALKKEPSILTARKRECLHYRVEWNMLFTKQKKNKLLEFIHNHNSLWRDS